METTRFTVKFKKPLDYYGDIILQDQVICLDESAVARIIYNSYYLQADDFKIIKKEPVTLFKNDRAGLGVSDKLLEFDLDIADMEGDYDEF